MFDKFFVTCRLAIELRSAGFDEPCMAVWRNPAIDDKTQSTLEICFDSNIESAWMYTRRNGSLRDWQFAAPLYDQVFDWLFSKGIYIHPYYISPVVIQNEGVFGCNVYASKDNSLIWPQYGLLNTESYHHAIKRDAIEQAMLEAIKLIPNKP